MIGSGRFKAGCGLASLLIASGGVAPTAIADSFLLKNGQVIEGSVLNGTLNTLTIRSGTAVKLTSVMQIERVVVEMADGSEISGELVGWRDGVYEILTDGDVLRIADGLVLEGEEPATQTAEEDTAPAESAGGDVVATLSETVAMRGLPSFILKNGDVIVGRILHATGSVMTIRPQGGSALPISRAQIESVTFESDDGTVVSGKLTDWEDGVYRVQTDDDRELLANLPDSAAKAAPPLETASGEPAVQPLDTPVAAEIEQADAAAVPPANGDQTAAAEDASASGEVGVGGPANETAVAALAEDGQQHRIEAQVEAVDEDGDSAVVQFQLNKPAERPLVVLYAATDASAKAGEDFEAKSGVVTFTTGSSYAEVQVPIIDDDEGEGKEEFNLFLSGDPETIAFARRQIAVTINDDD